MTDSDRIQTLGLLRVIGTALTIVAIWGLLGLGQAALASDIDPANRFAWSTNTGWVNFAPACDGCEGVSVYNDHLEGYAYSENAGWIHLGTYTGGGAHTYPNTSAVNYGVNRDPGTGVLSGFAWSTAAGWINFASTNGSVTVDDNGNLSGYAWAENIGWISFSGTAQDSTEYKVATGGQFLFFSVGGTVSGLAGTGLRLQINLGEIIELTENGGFNFPTKLVKGSNYSVTVFSEPTGPGQTCSVSNANGTLADGDVSDILITCVDKPEEIFADGFEG